MIWELFLLGTWPFWLLVLGLAGSIAWTLDHDNGIASTVFVAVFIGLLWLFGDFRWSMLWENFDQIAKYIVFYLIGGFTWVWGRWFFLVFASRRRFREFKGDWMAAQKLPRDSKAADLNPELQNDFLSRVSSYERRYGEVNPQISQNKKRLTMWAIYWPVSFIWTFINDPVRRFFVWIIWDVMGKSFQRASDMVFKDDLDDINKTKAASQKSA